MTGLGLALAAVIGLSLGFFGGGGSILTVPLLVYVFGLEPKVAIASSLLIVAVASLSGALQHARAGNLQPRTAVVFGAAGLAGAYLGGRASAWVAGEILLVLFAAVMIGTALAMWRGRRAVDPAATSVAPMKLALQGTIVGGFTGLVGAGGGFLIVPALVLWAGLPMPAAVGTSLAIIVGNSLAGFAGYAAHVSVDPGLVASVAGVAVLGSFGGSQLARRIDPATLRKGFATFVLGMGAVILVREGQLVVQTASEALPSTLPQLVFVLVVLGAGVAAGRASRAVSFPPVVDLRFEEGDGI
ncbi:MAG: sulfite exporter TauE/SafE family protein [Myxococcota bacterium]